MADKKTQMINRWFKENQFNENGLRINSSEIRQAYRNGKLNDSVSTSQQKMTNRMEQILSDHETKTKYLRSSKKSFTQEDSKALFVAMEIYC